VRGDHSTEVNLYARKNSACTFDEQARLQFGLDSGGKPGGIHSAMTKKVTRMLMLQGKDSIFRCPMSFNELTNASQL
jgi:hypothetical protein